MKAICPTLVVLSLIASSSVSLAQSPITILEEGFENSIPSTWVTYTQNGAPFSLWRHEPLSFACDAKPSGAAVYRETDCNYQNGFTHDGVLKSSVIQIPSNCASSSVTLTFKHLRMTDVSAGTATRVYMIWPGLPGLDLVSTFHSNTATEQSIVVNLTNADPGDLIQLLFNFVENSLGNSGIGWAITNVKVECTSAVPPPSVSGTAPSFAPTNGAPGVVIQGANFNNVTDVRFGNVSATFSVTNANEIVATAPASASTGWVDVTVSTSAGTSVLPSGFDYYPPVVDIGSPCGPAQLTYSGAPVIGQEIAFTAINLPLNPKHKMFIDYSNVTPPSCSGTLLCRKMALPMLINCPPPYCGLAIGFDQVWNLGSSSGITLNIPPNSSLVGVQYSVQSTYLENGCLRSTQGKKATIGF